MLDLRCADIKFDFPEEYLSELSKHLISLRSYPESSYSKLKTLLAKKFDIKTENISLSNGSDELIDNIIRTFNPSTVGFYDPSFYIYKERARLQQKSIESLPLSIKNNTVEFKMGFKKAELIFIDNPNNPTGQLVPREKLLELTTRNEDSLIVIDEAHHNFSKETFLPFIDDHKNVIILRSFSKDYGLAGLRLGFAISSPKNIQKLEKMRLPFNVNGLCLPAIELAFKHKLDEHAFKIVSKMKSWFLDELKRLNYDFFPSAANYVLVKVNVSILSILEERQILVKKYIIGNEVHVRIPFSRKEDLIKVLEVLEGR